MRFVICGAGQVGYSIASYLSGEENDVTVIDNNPKMINQINNELDVNGILGHASNPEVLQSAGAAEADMIITVTHSDEVNMVACQVAHSLFSVPKKIARVRDQSYLDPAWSNLFSRAHMPIDVIISPEIVVAQDIYQRLSVPGTTFVIPLADHLVHIAGVICGENCPLLNTPVEQLAKLFPDLAFKVLTILRNNKPIMPEGSDQIMEGDEVYFVSKTRHLQRVLAAFGHEEKEARSIVIAGGGNIGYNLAKLLKQSGRDSYVKIIERNEERAAFLSENLEGVIVLQGDGLDKEILEEASIETTETLVAITNDDESNILGSLLAKQYGCERVITLVNNKSYSPLIAPLGIDVMISPRSTIVAGIMQHVRRGRIKGLHNLRDGFAEVMEAEVSESTNLANKKICDLGLPEEAVVAAIIRDDEAIIPDEDDVIRNGDTMIVMALQGNSQILERIFSVQVDLF